MTVIAALLLGDGRFPAGGHAHSGGLEPLVEAGMIWDVDGLGAFLEGRLATAGSVTAALAAAACISRDGWTELQAEADARIISPAQRETSRAQGRQLLRAARAIFERQVEHPALLAWGELATSSDTLADGPRSRPATAEPPEPPGPPGPPVSPGDGLAALERAVPEGPHHPVALGATAAAAGLEPLDAARLAAYGAVAGPASAAVRLLGLDPFAVHAVLARLAPAIEAVAAEAATAAAGPLEDLPCPSAPMLDVAAERHLEMEVRLFAS